MQHFPLITTDVMSSLIEATMKPRVFPRRLTNGVDF